ncbi:oxidoreductase [Ktedonobacter sp. SOSP1-52]|uniref:aldo/keto reductase n=1 Tax=Ktedonobacter sp. SOSP1-52 TaxID=2778366 RepID=UPI0019167495|nr:aldo/keto reductase [Ktedonobacter sp. SOSP1-52]GHO70694.1 oxidoreductase [Ktedonobacter sp. SOSP1-52]
MQQRILGSRGIQVSAIGLDCMSLSDWAYGSADEADSIKLVQHALDQGVTLLDTADIYGPFTSEEIVGKAIKGRREQVVLATKGGLVVSDKTTRAMHTDGSPTHLKMACEASLRRLGTDVIDLYQLHRPDLKVPIEESVGALAELVKEGKVRSIGLSECDVPTLERAYKVHPIATLQSELSLWTRDVLSEILPWCQAHGVAFLPFAPLGRGFLTGRYRSTSQFDKTDFRSYLPRFQEESLARNLAIVKRVEEVARRYEATPGQIALAWVLAQGEQVIPIPGTKHIEYLDENIGALAVTLSPADLQELNQLPSAEGTRY